MTEGQLLEIGNECIQRQKELYFTKLCPYIIYIENCDKLNNKLLQSLNSEPRHRDKLCIQAGGTITVLQIRANLHLILMT